MNPYQVETNVENQTALPMNTPSNAAPPTFEAPPSTAAPSASDASTSAPSASAPKGSAQTGSTPSDEARENPAQEDPAEENPAQVPDEEAQVSVEGFFEKAGRFMQKKNCNLNLMLSWADKDTLRLTVSGQALPEEDGKGKKKKVKKAPFKPFSLVATPEELDREGEGFGSYLKELVDQSQTLAEARARAKKATEMAVKAEKQKEKKAKERQKNASSGGPLFSGSEDKS